MLESGAPQSMVSCIMPTRNRRDFVLQSIRYFERQDYTARELIILDDGSQDLSSSIPMDERIRYFRLPPGMTTGAKRNHGCRLARGAIIAQWDDDDWYEPSRLSRQVEPLVADVAELSALSDCIFFELATWKFWRCSRRVFERMFVGNVHGGTLVFKRSVFEGGLEYPDASLAEDAFFLYRCNRKGHRVHKTPDEEGFLYLRHPKSTWQFECGKHIDPRGWMQIPEPKMAAEDVAFFRTRAGHSRSFAPDLLTDVVVGDKKTAGPEHV
jgi:glycosyltransferase involved in cell wall biosynthesis